MVDTGTGTSESLRRLGLDSSDLDTIINTHRHPDHVSDLIPIVQDKVVNSFQSDQSKITLMGPGGHRNYLDRRMHDEMRASPSEVEEKFGFKIEINELEGKNKFEEIEISSISANHGPEDFPCLSVRISSEKDIVFSGDTDYFEELIDFSRGADLLVADCSKPDEEKVSGHMTPTECAEIAEEAQVKKLVLSHLYPEAESFNLKEKASKTFQGEVVVAEDLATIEI